jgi:hypothetical protein
MDDRSNPAADQPVRVLVDDLGIPVLDGFGFVAVIRSLAGSARLAVITALRGDEDVYRALQTDASG